MDDWLLENMVCPREQGPLSAVGDSLVCTGGHAYPVVRGIPVMLLNEVEQTQWVADASLKRAESVRPSEPDHEDSYFLDTIGISEEQRAAVRKELRSGAGGDVDPVVRHIVAATSGRLYRSLIGKLSVYPIPRLRLPPGNGARLLEIGCNWGRWCVAAGRRGYNPVGVDHSLGAVLAARRVTAQLGVPGRFVVGDGRYLPFRPGLFDVIFSYSVLQHLSRENVRLVLGQMARVLKDGGTSMIQMANAWGPVSLQHQLKRGFREAKGFEVRYWTPPELKRTFSQSIGPSSLSVDGYFGLGIQPGDKELFAARYRLLINCSEALRTLSNTLRWMKYFADSLYIYSVRRPSGCPEP